MATPAKSFDCVRLMRTIRYQLSQEFQGMSYEEQKKVMQKKLKQGKAKKRAHPA